MEWKKWTAWWTPRGVVLGVLGLITVGIAILSVRVSYEILNPHFGLWAAPTVGALDALWVIFQATEILAGNDKARVRRVQWAGLALTALNAAIPTFELIAHADKAGFDMAYVLTPVAIAASKGTWWLVLPSLGRRVSGDTRSQIDERRQDVADRLEVMRADAAHRVELLEAATELEKQVARAETAYRLSVLKTRQATTEALHEQAQATQAAIEGKPLPDLVTAITLPELETWTPVTPALPAGTGRDGSGTAASDRHGDGTQVNAGAADSGTAPGTPGVTESGTPSRSSAPTVTVEQLAAVAGVPVPVVGERLTDPQMDVVLRHLRYADEPPRSYRQAVSDFRDAGYVGSEERVRRVWGGLMTKEETPRPEAPGPRQASEETDTDDDSEDADA
ncbi:hypothetical protein [Streptomyces fuscigenes]|uniref:hypothetical protein n=1 Tax=Streptomyces fuscigenes TaxID=1528880 RepID=UPI001F272F04|nr:hypothetical protein [Streptomyces fuscigenes]MCF3960471.1 hypothetical protein [Streptomyces fuscigenes]